MKAHIILAATFFAISLASFAQDSVADWQAKALQMYPDLAVPDSTLNKRFLELHQHLKETNPQLFDNPQWPFLLAQIVSPAAKPQAPAATFVVVTTQYKWPDGLASPVGEVERVIATDAQNYILWHPSGTRYPIPKEYAKLITVEEASLRLLDQRTKLYGQLSQQLTIEQMQQLVQLANQIQDLRNKQQQQQSGTLEQQKQMLDLIQQLQGMSRRR